jgi:predicted aspartyl protease
MGRRLRLAGFAFALVFALAARADDPPPEALLADLPFLDFPEPRRVVVDLAPEGHARALRFMLDTGASHSVATPRAAAALGIRVRRHKRDPYRRKTALGRDVQIYVDTASSDTASRTGWEYALLGGDFLGRYVLELDFAGRRVRFFDAGRWAVPESLDEPGQAVVPLHVRSNRPGVSLELNGTRRIVLVDTGAPPPLVVSGKFATDAGLPPNDFPHFRSLSALGPMDSELRRVETLGLGPFVFSGVPAVVNEHGWYNLGVSSDSVIGYELLAQFSRVRIDYPHRRMWLELNPDAEITFEGRSFDHFEDLFAPEGTPPDGAE